MAWAAYTSLIRRYVSAAANASVMVNQLVSNLRVLLAFILAPIFVGLMCAIPLDQVNGDTTYQTTVIFVSGVVFSFTLLFVLPCYLVFRVKKMYGLKPMLYLGSSVGLLIGLGISWAGAQFVFLGLFGGIVGALIFHFIHGSETITKVSNRPPHRSAI